MESIKNKLPENKKNFFNKLSNYLNEKIYFYGSIQRYDYFSKNSDIDVNIFTDNIPSLKIKLQNFLNVEKNDFKKIIIKHFNNFHIIKGYKLKYENKLDNIKVEISIFNNIDKEIVLNNNLKKINVPFYISFLLIILKFLYYNLLLIPKSIFIKIKDFLHI